MPRCLPGICSIRHPPPRHSIRLQCPRTPPRAPPSHLIVGRLPLSTLQPLALFLTSRLVRLPLRLGRHGTLPRAHMSAKTPLRKAILTRFPAPSPPFPPFAPRTPWPITCHEARSAFSRLFLSSTLSSRTCPPALQQQACHMTPAAKTSSQSPSSCRRFWLLRL